MQTLIYILVQSTEEARQQASKQASKQESKQLLSSSKLNNKSNPA